MPVGMPACVILSSPSVRYPAAALKPPRSPSFLFVSSGGDKQKTQKPQISCGDKKAALDDRAHSSLRDGGIVSMHREETSPGRSVGIGGGGLGGNPVIRMLFTHGAPLTNAGDSLTFSDTLMALQMMRAQFPKIEKVSLQPFILQSQLYSSVKDRTQVDRELESLKKEKVLRIFKLNTGQDDHAVMFMEDYFNQVRVAMESLGTKNEGDIQVFEWFKTYVIETKLDVGIEHHALCSLLSFGGKVKEEHVSLLINAGLLTRQLIDPNMYWFSIPNIGPVLNGLSQGRKELISFLNRRKYKEMLLAPLEKKQLRLSPLDMRFHLRDLIGSGHLKTVESPTGLIVRVSRE